MKKMLHENITSFHIKFQVFEKLNRKGLNCK